MNFEQREHRERARQAAGKQAQLAVGNAIREMVQTQGGRRMLHMFMSAMGVDGSSFNTNAMQQSYNAGRHDAGRWWINAIREHCPEMEAKVRAEGAAWDRERRGMHETGEKDGHD